MKFKLSNAASAAIFFGCAAALAGCGGHNIEARPAAMGESQSSPADDAYNAAKNSATPQAYLGFLERYDSDSRAQEIREGLTALEYGRAKDNTDPMSLEFFLKAYPASRYSQAARNLLKDRLYAEAKNTGDVYAYRAFLRRFPYDDRAPQIRQIIDKNSAGEGSAGGDIEAELSKILAADEFVARYSCAMILVAEVRSSHAQKADRMRTQIVDLSEAGAGLPDECSATSQLTVASQDQASFLHAAKALRGLEATQDQVTRLAKTMEEHGKLLLQFVSLAERKVADFEEQEYSDAVLGRKVIGNLELDADAKGSQTAKETADELRPLAKQAAGNLGASQKMKRQAALRLSGIELYLAELLTAKS
jgi:hypothetical protein